MNQDDNQVSPESEECTSASEGFTSPTGHSILGINLDTESIQGILLADQELSPVRTMDGDLDFFRPGDGADGLQNLWRRAKEFLEASGKPLLDSIVLCAGVRNFENEMDRLSVLAESAEIPFDSLTIVERPLAIAALAMRCQPDLKGPLAVFELESPFVVLYWIDVEDAQPKFVDFVGIDRGVLQESLTQGNFSAVFRDNWKPFLDKISSSATSPLPVILTGLRNQSLNEAVLSELDGEQATIPVVNVTESMTEQWPEIDPSCFAAAGAAVAPLTCFRREAAVADDEVLEEPQNEVEPAEIFNDTIDSQRSLQVTCANRPLFRRVYYENVLLERNDLRGAASQSELTELVGLELGFEFDAPGIRVHCLSGPSVQIGNRTLEPGDVFVLSESENCLRLSGLELQLHVMGF